MEKLSQTGALGLIGSILGLLAISIAIWHFIFGPVQISNTENQKLGNESLHPDSAIIIQIPETSIADVREKTVINMDTILDFLVIAISLAAIILGVISFIKYKDWRPGTLALILGSGAIAFQFAVAMLLMVLGVFIIIGFLISLGLT